MRGRNGKKADNPAADTPIAAATVGPAQQSAEPKAAAIALPADATNFPVIFSLTSSLPFGFPSHELQWRQRGVGVAGVAHARK